MPPTVDAPFLGLVAGGRGAPALSSFLDFLSELDNNNNGDDAGDEDAPAAAAAAPAGQLALLSKFVSLLLIV